MALHAWRQTAFKTFYPLRHSDVPWLSPQYHCVKFLYGFHFAELTPFYKFQSELFALSDVFAMTLLQ